MYRALCEVFSLLAPSDALSGNVPEFSNLYSCFESMRGFVPSTRCLARRCSASRPGDACCSFAVWSFQASIRLRGRGVRGTSQCKTKGNFAVGLHSFGLVTGGEQRVESLQNECLGVWQSPLLILLCP